MGVLFFALEMLGSFSRQIRRESVKSFGKTRSCGNYSYSRRYIATGSMLRASSISTRFVLPTTFANDFKGLVPCQSVRYYSSGDFPPNIPLAMPALSPTMNKGNIVKWLKKKGDEVAVGDAIADIETDKAVMKWDSIDDGFFVKGFVEEGTEDIPVGKIVALLAEEQDDVDKFEGYEPEEGESSSSQESEKKEEPKSDKKTSSPPQKSKGGRIFASPAARALAADLGIALSSIEGSGPNGRIVLADVENASSTKEPSVKTVDISSKGSSSSTADYEDIPNNNIRKVVASRLTESKQTIPHYYLTVDFCVDKLEQIRGELNNRANGKYKLSFNDFVIKASAMAMRKVPEVNSTWNEKSIRRFKNVAVNSDLGLFTPILPGTDNLGLADISTAVRSLADKAKDGKLSSDELKIGTFTISNLGMFGIKNFAAVINPPQACILAVGGIEKRVVVDGEGFKTSSFMSCTLSCDHRVVDGALGATWLKEFKSRMEDPITLLL